MGLWKERLVYFDSILDAMYAFPLCLVALDNKNRSLPVNPDPDCDEYRVREVVRRVRKGGETT